MIDRPVVLAAAGVIVACERSDAFEQRRFAGTVLADNDGDRPVETDFEVVAKERQAIRIGLAILDPRWIQPHPLQIRRGQINRAIFSGHSSGPSSGQLQLEAAHTQLHTNLNVTRTIYVSEATGRSRKVVKIRCA